MNTRQKHSTRPTSPILKSDRDRSKPCVAGSRLPLPESANCSFVKKTISSGLNNLNISCIAVRIEIDAKTTGPRYARARARLGREVWLWRIYELRFGARSLRRTGFGRPGPARSRIRGDLRLQ